MGRVRDDNSVAGRVAALGVVRAGDQDTGQLAMRAGRRLEGDGVES
jgi:hypothetical protein